MRPLTWACYRVGQQPLRVLSALPIHGLQLRSLAVPSRLSAGAQRLTSSRTSRPLAVHCRSESMRAVASGGLPILSHEASDEATIAVLGDLHLEPDQMRLFHKAQQQVVSKLSDPVTGKSLPSAAVVQLGDVGGYNHQPGSRRCFETAKQYLDGFRLPYALITGNHDLEGLEFETDEENLAVWTEVFGQRHYWATDAGPLLCIGLSTVRFRSNNHSAHEVHIDDAQLAWFEQQLHGAGDRPVAVFTHAPVLGSGLKAVLEVHVKNRCAWVNHSTNPQVFLELAHRFPNIKLWFSGHYHLSHDYKDSITYASSCAFVNTGVIGNSNRDGCRHSRILEATKEGYELFTLDHTEGTIRLDLKRSWDAVASPSASDEADSQADPERSKAGQHASTSQPSNGAAGPGNGSGVAPCAAQQWYDIGNGRLLARYPRLLCEYDAHLRAPVGAVFIDMDRGDTLAFTDSAGADLDITSSLDGAPIDCRAATTINLHAQAGNDRQAQRNHEGSFYTIFQHNKWRLRKEKEQAAAAARP